MRIETLTLGALGTNCYLLWTEGKPEALLIDCAGSAEEMLEAAEAHGLQIRLIVNTHGHMDHLESLGEMVRRTGARVAVHPLDAPRLRDPMLSGAALFGYDQEPVTPDLLLEEGETVGIDGTDIALTVLHTPGHTQGCICLLGDGVLFAGDTLFAGGIGRTDLPGGNEETMQASLTRLAELPGNPTVYPGHGPATTLDEERRHNPWLSEL
jgi:hydroxyacylglutathione hydrolase